MIYTSGTTGTPKGVVVGHRGLADFGAQQVTQYGITPESQTMHMASPSFDATVLEILMAVASGSTMHIVPPGIVGGAELAELMRDGHITHAFLTPVGADHHVSRRRPGTRGPRHRRRTPERGSRSYVVEWTAVVQRLRPPPRPRSSRPCRRRSTPGYTTLTIGRPIRGVSAVVLDERLQPVAPRRGRRTVHRR